MEKVSYGADVIKFISFISSCNYATFILC